MSYKKSRAEKKADEAWKRIRAKRRKDRWNKANGKKEKSKKKKKYPPPTRKDAEDFGSLLYHNRTKSEIKVSNELIKEGIIFDEQYPIKCGSKMYYADFYFENVFEQKYVIELDGYGHRTQEGREHDRERSDAMWKFHKIKTVRFWNPGSNKAVDRIINEICLLNPKIISNHNYREPYLAD